jgi:hypothetical protein
MIDYVYNDVGIRRIIIITFDNENKLLLIS